MRCINCDETSIEKDDNFCPKCGHWTSHGYSFLNDDNSDTIMNGKVQRQRDRSAYLFFLLFICIVIVIGGCMFRGQDILKPFVYVKRQSLNYRYGYNTTILKTDNQYFNVDVSDLDMAYYQIRKDFESQAWQCKNNYEVGNIEDELESNYNIISVSFCDISIDEVKKISDVIEKMYKLFPNIKGYLTNISITNSLQKDDFVAYFQPVYGFVNGTNNIEEYNRVNKTQILLNSYYFINNDTLSKPVKDNWYVKDSSWESLIAHEMGHYISYVTLLKSKNISNLNFISKDNIDILDNVVNLVNSGDYSKSIVEEAVNNYNLRYGKNVSVIDFVNGISNYASNSIQNKNVSYDEVIAESIHDYYLHDNNASKESMQIVNIIKKRLG